MAGASANQYQQGESTHRPNQITPLQQPSHSAGLTESGQKTLFLVILIKMKGRQAVVAHAFKLTSL